MIRESRSCPSKWYDLLGVPIGLPNGSREIETLSMSRNYQIRISVFESQHESVSATLISSVNFDRWGDDVLRANPLQSGLILCFCAAERYKISDTILRTGERTGGGNRGFTDYRYFNVVHRTELISWSDIVASAFALWFGIVCKLE